MNKTTVRLLLIFFAVLVGSALLVYIVLERTSMRGATPGVTHSASPESTPESGGASGVLTELFGIDAAAATAPNAAADSVVAVRIFLRFLIAAFLSAILAFRWRRSKFMKRNPYVAQTQI